MAQFTRGEDGKITVRVPKSPEVFEPIDGRLYIEETVSRREFRAAVAPIFGGLKPLTLTVESDGSISAISGGPLEEPILTGPIETRDAPDGARFVAADPS